jgi:hypothetical protein
LSEDPTHLFICFSSRDQATALEVVEFLEVDGLKCWISSRDVLPGDNYQESIVTALEGARCVVFLFSEASIASGEIRKELSLASSGNKPILPLRLSPVMPTGALRYELATHQWIDIFPDREKALGILVRRVRQVLGTAAAVEAYRPAAPVVAAARVDPTPRAPPSGTPPPGAGTRPPGMPIIAAGGGAFEAVGSPEMLFFVLKWLGGLRRRLWILPVTAFITFVCWMYLEFKFSNHPLDYSQSLMLFLIVLVIVFSFSKMVDLITRWSRRRR